MSQGIFTMLPLAMVTPLPAMVKVQGAGVQDDEYFLGLAALPCKSEQSKR
jgi:hypothetical protein